MSGFEKHDHQSCVQGAIAAAQNYCVNARLQFTPLRQRVLEILLQEHRALGAYEILDVLRLENLGSQPPVVYRALDFWVTHGFAHKIERLNAFVGCSHPAQSHAPAFLICRACDMVHEQQTHLGQGRLADTARTTGFAIERTTIEAVGICPKCQSGAQA